jgi:hypothetical protein
VGSTPTPQLVFILVLFAGAYCTYAVRKLRRRAVDLYDLPLLLALAIVPLLFAIWPPLTDFVRDFFGVALPLTVMFGLLFVAAFLIMHRLISRVHNLEVRVIRSVQEIGLLEERLRVAERQDLWSGRPAQASEYGQNDATNDQPDTRPVP